MWFHTNPKANDTNFEADLLKLVTSKTLLLLDRGFYHFQFFATLISQKVDFITRIKAGAAIEVVQVNTHPNMMFEINSLNLVQAVSLHQSSRCVELKSALVKLGIHTSLLSLIRLFYPLT